MDYGRVVRVTTGDETVLYIVSLYRRRGGWWQGCGDPCSTCRAGFSNRADGTRFVWTAQHACAVSRRVQKDI